MNVILHTNEGRALADEDAIHKLLEDWQNSFKRGTNTSRRNKTRKEKSSRTLEAYRVAMAALTRFLKADGISLLEAEEADINRWRNAMEEEGYAGATINLRLAAATNFYKHAKKKGLISYNPAAEVEREEVDRKPKTRITKAQEAALYDALSAQVNPLKAARDVAIVRLLLTTALRVSAVADATISDVVPSPYGIGYSLRYSYKGGSIRDMPLPPKVMKAIQDYLKLRGPVEEDAPLFAQVTPPPGLSTVGNVAAGRKLSRNAVTNLIKKAAKKAGIEQPIGAHTMRHTRLDREHKKGVPMDELQTIAGHSSSATTERYIERLADITGLIYRIEEEEA